MRIHDIVRRDSYDAGEALRKHLASSAETVNQSDPDDHDRTALHIAAERGRLDLVDLLLAHGANPAVRDSKGHRPLERAVLATEGSREAEAMERETRHLFSWPYSLVWSFMAGRVLRWSAASLVFVVLSGLVYVVHPRLSKLGNNPEAVRDAQPHLERLVSKKAAFAGSPDWLLMAEKDGGLTVLNTRSRVSRTLPNRGVVVDVASVPGSEAFWFLEEHAIGLARPRPLLSSVRETVPEPHSPHWPVEDRGSNLSLPLLATDLDAKGWLVAIKGQGVSRYVFDEGPSSAQVRTRSWVDAPLSQKDLHHVCLTDPRIVFALVDDDGQWHLGVADRESLEIDETSVRDTPPIVHLEADFDHGPAWAFDALDQWWHLARDASIWQGPFFGAKPEARLANLQEVRQARAVDDVLYLGTNDRLLVRNPLRRRLELLRKGSNIADFLITPPPPSEIKGGKSVLLVGGAKGALKVTGPNEQGDFEATTMDSSAVSSMSVSPTGGMCAYIARTGRGPDEVRALLSPFSKSPSRRIVLPDVSWGKSHFEVNGVLPLEGGASLFTTPAGAFRYNFERHEYVDLSLAHTSSGDSVTLSGFQGLRRDGDSPLAIADNTPVVLAPGAAPEGWWLLDPRGTTRPRLLTEAKGESFGLGAQGEIYPYGAVPISLEEYRGLEGKPTPEHRSRLLGLSDALGSRTEKDMILGDVLPGSQSWILGTLGASLVSTYDSSTGNWSNSAASIPGSPVQLRLTPNRKHILCSDGVVRDLAGRARFGAGAFPFRPEEATSVAPGFRENSVLVGGPEGSVVLYDWTNGSVELVGGRRAGSSKEAVVEIEWLGAEVLVRVDSGIVYSMGEGEQWSVIDGCRGWSREPGENPSLSTLWLFGDDGVTRLAIQEGRRVPGEPNWCRGRGMASLVAEARFAAPLGPDGSNRVGFFTRDGSVGVYDSHVESWVKGELPFKPVQYASVSLRGRRGVIAAYREGAGEEGLAWISPSLELTRYRLPSACTNIRVHIDGVQMRAAMLVDGCVRSISWRNFNLEPVKRAGRGTRPGRSFDLAQVYLATPHDRSQTLLIDREGKSATYSVASGELQVIQDGQPNSQLRAWVRGSGRAGHTLFLEDADGDSTHVLSLSHRGGRRDKCRVPARTSQIVAALRTSGLEGAARAEDHAGAFGASLRRLRAWTGGQIESCMDRSTGLRTGELLSHAGLQIQRANGTTQYSIRGGSMQLRPTEFGFSEDSYADVCIDSAGQTWGLIHGRREMVGLDLEPNDTLSLNGKVRKFSSKVRRIETLLTGDLRIHLDGGDKLDCGKGLQAVAVAAEVPLAMSDHGAGFRIGWRGATAAGGGIRGIWSGDGLDTRSPVFGRDGRIAAATIKDLAATADGKILTVTDLGLLVRDANFKIERVYSQLNQASLVPGEPSPGGSQVYVAQGGRWTHRWSNGSLHSAEDQKPIWLLATGPWRWTVYPEDTSTEARVQIAVGGHRRRVVESPAGGSRFADDWINWIVRSSDGRNLWLAAKDGLWPAFENTARSEERAARLLGSDIETALAVGKESFCWRAGDQWSITEGELVGGQPDAEVVVENAAVRVSLRSGRLNFESVPRLHGEVISEGRFAHDSGYWITAWEDRLFLLSQHGVVVRDIQNPARIEECWPLPEQVRGVDRSRLELHASDDRLLLLMRKEASTLAWSFSRPHGKVPWVSLGTLDPNPVASTGPFAWYRKASGNLGPRVRPYDPMREKERALNRQPVAAPVPVPESKTLPVERWWENGRFGWDRVWSAAALSETSVLITTPAGVLTVGTNGVLGRYWPIFGVKACQIARHDGGAVAGVLITTDDGKAFRAQSLGEVEVLGEAGANWWRHPFVELRREKDDEGQLSVCFVQDWDLGPAAESRPLRSNLASAEPPELLRAGEFIFDHADGAGDVELLGGEFVWISWRALEQPGESPRTLLCQNALVTGESGRLSFMVRDFSVVSGRPAAIRSAGGGEAFALEINEGGEPAFWRAKIQQGPLDWQRAGPAARNRFRCGARTTLDAASLEWEEAPLYLGEQGGEALFESPYLRHIDGGLGFSFDTFLSFSVVERQDQRIVEIATPQGVLTTSGVPRHMRNADLSYPLVRFEGVLGEVLGRGTKIRHDNSGHLWLAKPKESEQEVFRRAEDGWTREEGWLHDEFECDGMKVLASQDEPLKVAGRSYAETRNLWPRSSSPIRGILDVYHDDEDGVVWCLTSDHRIVKVIPTTLPR